MASQLQGARQRGHRIEMTGSRKTECTQSRHCPLQFVDFDAQVELLPQQVFKLRLGCSDSNGRGCMQGYCNRRLITSTTDSYPKFKVSLTRLLSARKVHSVAIVRAGLSAGNWLESKPGTVPRCIHPQRLPLSHLIARQIRYNHGFRRPYREPGAHRGRGCAC